MGNDRPSGSRYGRPLNCLEKIDMDHQTFDTLTELVSRRRLTVGGSAALILGMTHAFEDAEATCKRPGARCGRRGKCCTGGRCRGGRCRCKASSPSWAGVCCRERFVEVDAGQAPSEGTPVCCNAEDVCPRNADPSQDDCCLENELCVDGACCCDGCRGTVVCGGTCCAAASCCNGVCCGADEVCAETGSGVHTCVSANRSCSDPPGCLPGETCWGGVCCTPGRMCNSFNGSDPPLEYCCAAAEYCASSVTCCANGVGCSTGRKVRIRV